MYDMWKKRNGTDEIYPPSPSQHLYMMGPSHYSGGVMDRLNTSSHQARGHSQKPPSLPMSLARIKIKY
jgi:hypothetical protein